VFLKTSRVSAECAITIPFSINRFAETPGSSKLELCAAAALDIPLVAQQRAEARRAPKPDGRRSQTGARVSQAQQQAP
jgi:hypothetical protein